MNVEPDHIRQLAGRIARRVGEAPADSGATPEGTDLLALRADLREIKERLAHIESHLGHGEDCREAGAPLDTSAAPALHSPWLTASGSTPPDTLHPSGERFGVGEAVAELVDYFERAKTCELEPGGKPCDHCAMCSSRGF